MSEVGFVAGEALHPHLIRGTYGVQNPEILRSLLSIRGEQEGLRWSWEGGSGAGEALRA
jgi:hypothetical protein